VSPPKKVTLWLPRPLDEYNSCNKALLLFFQRSTPFHPLAILIEKLSSKINSDTKIEGVIIKPIRSNPLK
jgi:hypothetical protein